MEEMEGIKSFGNKPKETDRGKGLPGTERLENHPPKKIKHPRIKVMSKTKGQTFRYRLETKPKRFSIVSEFLL